MKFKSILLIASGVVGSIFISFYDVIMGKSINDVTGPKSIAAYVLCLLVIIQGIILIPKKTKKS